MDAHLCTAMVERWRPETHTFFLPTGECTITLEDVSILLGLRIHGRAITGSTYVSWDTVEGMLGAKVPPGQRDGYSLKLKWLEYYLQTMPNDPTYEQLVQHCRAYILHLIGALLMPNKKGNIVHLKWLQLLHTIEDVRSYSWGSACLATLYRSLCDATHIKYSSMAGCTLLLQIWAKCRMLGLAPERTTTPPDGPLGLQFSFPGTVYHANPSHDIVAIRANIDHIHAHNFIWRPYHELNIEVPEEDALCWSAVTYLICFEIVEFHQIDRVRLQFGFQQQRPKKAMNMSEYHSVDRRGTEVDLWYTVYAKEINHWNNRLESLLQGDVIDGEPVHSSDYLTYYRRRYNDFLHISTNQFLRDPRQQPTQSQPQPRHIPIPPQTTQEPMPPRRQEPSPQSFSAETSNLNHPPNQTYNSSQPQYPSMFTTPPMFNPQSFFTQITNLNQPPNQQTSQTITYQSFQQFTSFTNQSTHQFHVNSTWTVGPSNTSSMPVQDDEEDEDDEQEPVPVRRNKRCHR